MQQADQENYDPFVRVFHKIKRRPDPPFVFE